jgi:hypothetical protein
MILGKKKPDVKEPTFVTLSPKNVDMRGGKTPALLRIVDEFVEKFYDGDYIIDRAAFQVPCGRSGIESNLGKFLQWSVRNYVVAKSEVDVSVKISCADEVLSWLTMARGAGLIGEGKGVKTKFAQYESEIKQLQEEAEQLRKKLILCEKESEELHKFIDKQFGGSSVAE